MRTSPLPWLILLAAALSVAAATTPQATPAATAPTQAPAQAIATALNAEGREFLRLVAQDDLLQIEAARLATARATSPEVHAFADSTLRSRSRVQDSLIQLAAKRGAVLPGAVDESTARQLLNELQAKSGPQFDLAYSQAMLEAHRAAVRRFEQAARSDTQDADVRAFATAQLPGLRDYLRMAQTLPSTHQG
jgi:putative membrane protein